MISMKEFFTKYKKDVVVGVITSIVASFIWSIGDTVVQGLPDVGNSIVRSWINGMYSAAAGITQYTVGQWGLFLLLCICLFGYFFVAIDCIKTLMTSHRILQSVALIEKSPILPETNGEVTPPNEHQPEKKKRTDAQDIKKETQKLAKKTVLSLVKNVILSMFTIVFLFSYGLYPLYLNNMFARYSTIIRPYISENEYHMLLSDWASMKTKDDFDTINAYVLKVRQENGLASAEEAQQ